MADVKRATRVAEGLREELARLLATKTRDPRIAGVVIARVELSDDLRNARVYVRLLAAEPDEAARASALEGLDRASGLLRREVTKALKLRYAPELRFFYDEGQDARTRIEELLEEIRRDKPREE